MSMKFQDIPQLPAIKVSSKFRKTSHVVLACDDSLNFLKTCPDSFVSLIVTSPPYNLGKDYEQKIVLEDYLTNFNGIINELIRVLSPTGSICWQVGNYINNKEIFPLDIFFYNMFKKQGLILRNRIIWTFEHGLHCSRRFSGRYETLLWFTKTDNYTFNLDSVRVPHKYPGKTNSRPGPRHGTPSCNPLGKNPGDFWTILSTEWDSCLWNIPNVKANHPEKTIHPCQFPIELAERCVLAMTEKEEWVLDPFCGVGSAILAAIMNGRKAIGCDKEAQYIDESRRRLKLLTSGLLPYRQLGKPIFKPTGREKVARLPIDKKNS